MKGIILLMFTVILSVTAKAQTIDTAKIDTQRSVHLRIAPGVVGGFGKLAKYLNKNTKYPEIAKKNRTQGRVLLTFIIERDGSLTDIKIAQSVSPETDAEAIRVMSDPKAPKWTPGIQDDKPVRVQYVLPIVFKI
jgi:protein TonB